MPCRSQPRHGSAKFGQSPWCSSPVRAASECGDYVGGRSRRKRSATHKPHRRQMNAPSFPRACSFLRGRCRPQHVQATSSSVSIGPHCLSDLFNRWHPGQPSRCAVDAASQLTTTIRPREEIVSVHRDRRGARKLNPGGVFLCSDESITQAQSVVACFAKRLGNTTTGLNPARAISDMQQLNLHDSIILDSLLMS